jgi:DNA polymerase III subunit gamma/tau
MSYLVLARKLRPKTFHDIIGQEHIWKTLISAIKTDRVAHAFLFTGPRGTGKTSCARVLTKALNCLAPIDHEPCNQCDNCLEINKGIATDVLEIDAASNRGIEHIRELREGVKFSPAKCTYKTYIIDEVHMLTTESFNALLKTLEEPPSHVKFILATTDHHKVPITVISRCQRYDFTNISSPTMVQYLKKVAANENLDISESALMLIANHAAGGMRDALTTMDMLIGQSSNQVQDDDVVEILGLNNTKEVDELLYFIVEKNLAKALDYFHSLTAKGRSLTQLITDLLRAVKDLSLVTSLQEEQIHWHQFLPDQFETYQYLSRQVTTATLQQYFQILLDVEIQIKRSSQAKICTEMGIIKLCGVESIAGVAEVLSLLKEHAGQPKKKDLNLIQDVLKSNTNLKTEKNLGSFKVSSLTSKPIPENSKEIEPSAIVESIDQATKIIPIDKAPAPVTGNSDNEAITVNEPDLETHYTKTENGFPKKDQEVLSENIPEKDHISSIETKATLEPNVQTTIPVDNKEVIETPLAEAVISVKNQVEIETAPQLGKQSSPKVENQITDSNLTIADQWCLFVENVGKSGNKSLLSLLRNSVILELTDKKLVIGYQNIQIFGKEKKKSIADVARSFFNPDIKVYYKEQDNGIAASIKTQKDAALVEQKKALKEKAAKNPKVLKTLEIFPGSEIKKITILEELKND